MKRHRLFMCAVTAGAILVCAFVIYSYYLGQRTRERLAQRSEIPAVERYKRIQEAMVQESIPSESNGGARDSLDTAVLTAGFARMDSVSNAVEAFADDDGPWESLWQSLYGRPPSAWTAAEWTTLSAMVAEQATLLQHIRELSNEAGPLCPIDFNTALNIGVPHLKPMRDLSRLLLASALVRARAGDYQEACEDILAGYRLAERLHHEPIFISQITRFNFETKMQEGVASAFPPGQIPDALLQELQAHLESREAREDLLQAWLLMQERVLDSVAGITTGSWKDSRQGVAIFSAHFSLAPLTSNALVNEWYVSPAGTPWRNFDLQALANSTAKLDGVFQLSYAEALDAVNSTMDALPSTRYIARTVVPFALVYHDALSSNEARQRLLILGAAVERYANTHGSYPESLDAVAAEIGAHNTIDPFTGEPFRYQVGGGSVRLYSVGANLSDDGGQHRRAEGDILWRGEEEAE